MARLTAPSRRGRRHYLWLWRAAPPALSTPAISRSHRRKHSRNSRQQPQRFRPLQFLCNREQRVSTGILSAVTDHEANRPQQFLPRKPQQRSHPRVLQRRRRKPLAPHWSGQPSRYRVQKLHRIERIRLRPKPCRPALRSKAGCPASPL